MSGKIAKSRYTNKKINHIIEQIKKNPFIVIAIFFALVGTIWLVSSSASTYSVALEPETGNITGCAEALPDNTASGTGTNKIVRFGTGSNCSTPPSGENTFTLASIPDTQVEVSHNSFYNRFTNRMEWIRDNKTNLNIKYVWQVGDLQNWDDGTHSHYERASNGLKILEQAGVPYALTVGNHDTSVVCMGGKLCIGDNQFLSTALREIPTWDQYYPPTRFPGIKTLCSEFSANNTRLMAAGPSGSDLNTPTYVKNQCQKRDTTANAYRTFNAGGLKWLLINYEIWPRQVVQEWMKIVLERYPDHNAILFTHMHLNLSDSPTPLTNRFGSFGSPQGSPQTVYDNVISKYPNVRFTFSGHYGRKSGCAVFTGTKGNKIYSYLNDRIDSAPIPNHLRLMKFNVSEKTVTSQEYVPLTGKTLSQASNCNATNVDWVR